MPGGHIEAFYILGGLAMYPSAHTQGGMIHLRGGRATFRGGEVPPLPPSKKKPANCNFTFNKLLIDIVHTH